MKNTTIKICLISLLGLTSLLLPLFVSAATINLGTLDVKLANGQEQINTEIDPAQNQVFDLRVSNFSEDTKNLEIYSTDAFEKENGFIANDGSQISEDLSPWIKLPTNNLELKGGESKILSVTLNAPENAGIGMHTGAIMLREKILARDNKFNIEKGIRIYANIKGVPVSKYAFKEMQLTTENDTVNISGQIINQGNTDLRGSSFLHLQSFTGSIIESEKVDYYLKPGAIKNINLEVPKPAFGFFTASLFENFGKIKNTGFQTSIQIIPPLASLLALLIGIALLAISFKLPKASLKLLKTIKESNFSFKTLEFQKVAAFALLLAISFGITAEIKSGEISHMIKASLLESDISPANNWYTISIKHGNFNHLSVPAHLQTKLNATFMIEDADVEMTKKLDSEPGDIITLDQGLITMNLSTSSDIDGAEFLIKPLYQDKYPVIRYKNNDTNREESLFFKELLKNGVSSTGSYGLQITASVADKENKYEDLPFFKDKLLRLEEGLPTEEPVLPTDTSTDITPETITDITSTTEIAFGENLEALTTGEIAALEIPSTPDISENIGILNQIIEETPTTPEVMNQYILNSDYVDEINKENELTTIKADPELIQALNDSPETIKDITSTPELNFIFLPNKKIKFAPQNFSFSKENSTIQELGQIIFVQNKETPWNTYISVSDFKSEDGQHTIPASAITIIPGEVTLLSTNTDESTTLEEIISKGENNTLENSQDQSLLVSITPTNDSEAVFSIKPMFRINVAPGTPPGVYRAQITFKTL